MIVKAIFKNKDFNYFRDKVTNKKRVYGDVFECDDELAKERIAGGFVEEVVEINETQNNEKEKTLKDKLQEKIDKSIEDGKIYQTLIDRDGKELSYKDLQDLAKEKGLKYIGVSKENLIKSLKELENGDK